jgi:nucleoside-diphosphate-sugar epimerase
MNLPAASPSALGAYAGARAVVFGATGFIGRWVARALFEHGARVYLVVRDQAAAREIFTRFAVHGQVVQCDLEETNSLGPLLESIRPAITFNLAGYGVDHRERDERKAYAMNWRLVSKLTAALAAIRYRRWPGRDLVHVGSVYEYGDIGGDLAEDSIPNPITAYGRSKLAGTRALARDCAAYDLRGVTARLFSVFGPGEHQGRLLPSLLDAARRGTVVQLTSGRQERDFAYVEDVAEGLLRVGLAATAPGEIINIATGRMTSVRAFAETAGRILGLPSGSLQFEALPDRPEELQHRPVSLQRLRRRLGWAPRTGVAEGIARTIAHGHASRGLE